MEHLVDWLSKEWYWKIFDIGLILSVFLIFIIVVHTAIKTLRITYSKNGLQFGGGKSSKDIIQDKNQEILGLKEELLGHELKDEFNKKVNLIPLTNHSVFMTLQDIIERGIELSEDVDGFCAEKCEINKLFLQKCKAPTLNEGLTQWVKELLLHSGNEEELTKVLFSVVKRLYSWINIYTFKATELIIEFANGDIIKGVPDSYMVKFDEWHTPRIKMLTDKIPKILISEFYHSWQMKSIAILELFDVVLILMKFEAERTLNSINGELDREIALKLGK
jgi:hypothetical protein